MIFDINELARAVFFFDDTGVLSKQLNIAEFQAVLDGFVPLKDMAGLNARACYLEINADFHVLRAVFFRVPINKYGEIHRAWHMPLIDLASAASRSKDLGGGPIQLACYSQCPIGHFRKSLWDPDLSPQNNHLVAIKKAVAENKLGIQFREESVDEAVMSSGQRAEVEKEISARLRKEYAHEFRDHMAQLLKEQRLRLATSRNEFKADARRQKLDLEARIDEYKQLLEEKEKIIAEQSRLNKTLKETVDGQAQKISAMREYFDFKIEQAQIADDQMLKNLGNSIEAEVQAQYTAEISELKETLQTREVELLYRNELEVQLHDEIARLRDANQKTLSNTGEEMLQKMVEKGISLVSFQPGAGHLTIPVNEVARYLESPSAYAAEQCGVSEQRYESWLAHYRMPVCQQTLDDGGFCGENIERVENPIDFNVGESDSCTQCRKRRARSHLRLAGA